MRMRKRLMTREKMTNLLCSWPPKQQLRHRSFLTQFVILQLLPKLSEANIAVMDTSAKQDLANAIRVCSEAGSTFDHNRLALLDGYP